MDKFYQCIQSYGPSFMTKFCSALYLENLLTNIFAKLNLRDRVSCMPAALLLQECLNVVIIENMCCCSKKLKWHIGLGLSVRAVYVCVCSVRVLFDIHT